MPSARAAPAKSRSSRPDARARVGAGGPDATGGVLPFATVDLPGAGVVVLVAPDPFAAPVPARVEFLGAAGVLVRTEFELDRRGVMRTCGPVVAASGRGLTCTPGAGSGLGVRANAAQAGPAQTATRASRNGIPQVHGFKDLSISSKESAA